MKKRYNHQQHEPQIRSKWEEAQAFNPDVQVKKQDHATNQTFTIIMPPPNANDPLHIGHVMFISIEDALIRFHRMLGDQTLWLPGTDHAGIETQYVFEKKLSKKSQSRFDFDRQTLFQKIWDYVVEKSDVAINQIKQLGASTDWSRYKFTLDNDIVDDVLGTFERLEKEGLIYRANRLVNYCTKCGTAFSELEVEHQEQTAPLYYIKYGPLTVATTRPETKFADIALAVNPEDKRYQQYVGQTLSVPGIFKTYQLPVIADEFVDPEFGTGVVKITPHHDKADFEFWQRHQAKIPQPPIKAIDYQGRMTAVAEKYEGLKAHTARKQVVSDLKTAGLLQKTDSNYQNTISVCYRCKRPIEPLPRTQFYIKTEPLVQPVLNALNEDKIKVYGAGHDKILRHWLEILEDWNISRQIVWGIQIPVWYSAQRNPEIQVAFIDQAGQNKQGKIGDLLSKYQLQEIRDGLQSLDAPLDAKYIVSRQSPGPDFIQETDTFDTWFSSSQWPVVTLKNTNSEDFNRFYPTNVMETGYDILMFWVMRMLMMGKFMTDQLPFNKVYLHGLIRDEKGEKMSKSKGNVIDPLDVTEKYGTDALRMALIIRSSAGLDKAVGHPDFKAARNLSNKLWNATRYILMNLESDSIKTTATKHDEQFFNHLQQTVNSITRHLREFKLGLAAETLYADFWHWYCDECIEQAKQERLSASALVVGLITYLKLIHPFMPFVTEALWDVLRENKQVKSLVAGLEESDLKTRKSEKTGNKKTLSRQESTVDFEKAANFIRGFGENELLALAPWPSLEFNFS